MQPLKITIRGNFWDVQIYRDRLHLWDMNGDLSIYNWEESLEPLFSQDTSLKLPLICAFSRGDYLYNANFDLIFGDNDFKELLQEKFTNVNSDIELTPVLRATQENPFKELQIDSEVYDNRLYSITSSGLWYSTAHRSSNKYPISSKPNKIWDGYLQSIKAHSNKLALSGGSEGLFEYLISGVNIYNDTFHKPEDKITQLSEEHSLYSTWSFSSIYSTSDIGKSFLHANYWDNSSVLQLKHGRTFDESDIFSDYEDGSFSWSEYEKIYSVKDSTIKVVNFNQSNVDPNKDENAFEEVFSQEFQNINSQQIVMADVANFGTIIEDDNGLIVLRSDGEDFRINGQITRWRVYPRAKRYENHLHVILDDRIEIYSFNHDYFVDQKSKIFGIQHRVANIRFGGNSMPSIF